MGKGDPFQLTRQWGGCFACDGRPCRNADPLGPRKLLYGSFICVFFFSYIRCRVSHLVFKISLSHASMWKGFPRDRRHLVFTVHRPPNSYTTDVDGHGTLFFRSSYLLWRLSAVVIKVWSSSWKSRFNLWLFPFSLEHKDRILSAAGKKYLRI